MELTQEYVKSLFDYKDGYLYWNVRMGQRGKVGILAGFVKKATNRRLIAINRKQIFSARLIFLYHHGYMPEIVDHKDRNTLNENITNLRSATKGQNNSNTNSRKNSTSQYLGVSWDKDRNKWQATLRSKRKQYKLGVFTDEVEAAKAYNENATFYHGEFANLNIIL